MDFDDSVEEARYRTAVQTWIAEAAADIPRRPGRRPATHDELALAKLWQSRKADAGYACIDWPVDRGGPGGTIVEKIIFEHEEQAAGLNFPFFRIGLGICLPTVAAHADPATRARLVPPAMRGEDIWCQLFSEPGAGSDLAAATTRARRDGDGWLIEGRKIWTSYAQFSDRALLLARTDPEAPKHKGLTMFWLDLDTPGLTLEPLRQMSGETDFNEVVLNDVRLPDSQRLGAEGEGWALTRFSLMNERVAIGAAAGMDHRDHVAMLRDIGADADPVAKARLADWYVLSEGLALTRNRIFTALSRGDTPGPENAIGKLVAASHMIDLARHSLFAQGQMGLVEGDDAPFDNRFQHLLLWAPGYRLGGGSDEILRNVIAERVLGLPADRGPAKG